MKGVTSYYKPGELEVKAINADATSCFCLPTQQ